MAGLLDDGLLSGQYEVSTSLRPERHARPVLGNDLTALSAEIDWVSQVWGGGSQPLLPVIGGRLPNAYDQLLRVEQIDFVGGLAEVDLQLPPRVRAQKPWDHPALAVAAAQPPDEWRTVRVTDLEERDPWRLIYDAVLGRWPAIPDRTLSEFAGLREDLAFEDVMPVERDAVAGSLEDLIDRLANHDFLTPRLVSNVHLAYGLQPDTSYLGADSGVLPNPRQDRRAAGPNLIVAVGPGSVEDIALLWNLRGAHGSRRVMPIGMPVEQIHPEGLRELEQPGRATMFGFGGGACYLTSATVSLGELEQLAAEVPSVRVVPYENLLTFGPAPGRIRSHVCNWVSGSTRLDPVSDADSEILSVSRDLLRQPQLVLDVWVDRYLLPADVTMRGSEYFGRYQAGRAQVAVPELRGERTIQVDWPSSWTCVAAVGKSRGLDVQESEPGLAAATLIRALGSIDQIGFLLHPPLIDLIYRMAERSGMAWWKKRWTDTHRKLLEAGVDEANLDGAAVALGRDEPVVAPPGEGRAVPFQDFVKALGSEKAARSWVAWAERRHLLVRGADIECLDCRTRSWLPLAALPPPVPCPGCGRQIDQPYGPRELRFTYRLGEPLRRVLETDSLGHVLALRWLVALFDRHGLVGAHPGVTFTDPAREGQAIGEADVLLLFGDGSLVPIEVKRRLAGADERTAGVMDSLAEALDAPWDALVVTEPAREVPRLEDAGRRLPDRPRLLLTDDQLYSRRVSWTVGADPFGWDPVTEEQDVIRRGDFVKRLEVDDLDVSWDRVGESLLATDDS